MFVKTKQIFMIEKEINMNEVKKWKTIAIAAIIAAVIAISGVAVLAGRSGSTPQAGTTAETEAVTEPAGSETAEAQAAGTETAEAQAAGTETAEAEPAAENTEEAAPVINADEYLSYWTEDSPLRQQLVSYMEAITEEGSPDYIPVEDRIAVFDFDGTLFCETDPNYFDYTLLLYRVTEDPEYKEIASEFEKSVAAKIKDQNENGTKYEELPVEHGQAVASAFKGMTYDEFSAYIQEFKKLPMPSYEGMTRGGGFYEPMLQVVNYLKANDFTVYVISGTDRFICRGLMENSPLVLPNKQIIGSDELVVSKLQNGVDGLDYTFEQGDDLILGGEFIIKNLKMNKVTVINREIGQQPVLSFGNTTGDAAMANYTLSKNPYKSLAFMLCCDDLERENGNINKANQMYDLCEEFHWIPVSMKNDWTTIYADGVTYIGAQKAETEAAENAEAAEQAEEPAEEAAEEQTEDTAAEPAEEQTEEEELDNAA